MPAAAVSRCRWWPVTGVPLLLAFLSPAAVAQATVEVSIADYRFTPAVVSIKAGDTVRWTNNERRTSHSVLFVDENGLESERLFPGEHWQRRFDQAGRYAYQCGPHPEMKGEVLVSD